MIGIDIFEVKRVEKLLKRKNFLNRFFSESEIKYIYSKKFSHNTVAGLISAKEAVLKALGIGISTEISLRDVEILHDKGVPFVNIKNNSISKLMKNRDIGSFDLSISHDGGYAISVCETREGIFVTDEMFKEFLPLRRIDFHKGLWKGFSYRRKFRAYGFNFNVVYGGIKMWNRTCICFASKHFCGLGTKQDL